MPASSGRCSNGADVINLSIQGPHSQGLQDACDAAYDAGVLIVAAGGNSLAGGGPVKYPAAYDSVIAVTATDTADLPGYFAPVGNALELAAPGVDVLSTVARGGYDYLSGTSQAAPHVAGAAALYMAFNTKDVNGDGTVNNKDVRLLLQSTATDLGDAGKDAIFGYGLVNARGAEFADDEDELVRTNAECWISKLLSCVVDHLFSRVVPVDPSPKTQEWLKSTQTALSRFLDSVWTWKTSGPRSVAGMFGKR